MYTSRITENLLLFFRKKWFSSVWSSVDGLLNFSLSGKMMGFFHGPVQDQVHPTAQVEGLRFSHCGLTQSLLSPRPMLLSRFLELTTAIPYCGRNEGWHRGDRMKIKVENK